MSGLLGVAVIGPGWCGSQQIAAFRTTGQAEIRAIVGPTAERARGSALRHGVGLNGVEVYGFDQFDQVLARPDIDVIVISTPNDQHAEQAVAAAQAGKHLLLEKPMGMSTDEVAAIVDAVEQAGVRSLVSHELRFDPYLQYVKWLASSGRLGAVQYVRVQYLSQLSSWYPGWTWVRTVRHGGSHLIAAGIHAMDAMRWLAGTEFVSVSAMGRISAQEYEYPTTIQVNLRAQSGLLAHVTSSTDFAMPYQFSVEVMGDKMCVRNDAITWLDAAVDLHDLASGAPPGMGLEWSHDHSGLRITGHRPDSADVTSHPFDVQAAELLNAILQDRPTCLEVRDAAQSTVLCLAADRSAELQGVPQTPQLIPAKGPVKRVAELRQAISRP